MHLAQPHHDGRIDGIPTISPPLRPVHRPWTHDERLVADIDHLTQKTGVKNVIASKHQNIPANQVFSI